MERSLFPKTRFLPLPLLWMSALLLGGVGAGIGLNRGVHVLRGGSSGSILPVGEARAGKAEGETAGAGAVNPDDPEKNPPAFSLEAFQKTQGLEMHRLLARVLPGADAALVRELAEDLVKREPPLEKSPVWRGVMARWVRLEPSSALAWARVADGRAALAREGTELEENEDGLDPFAPKPLENSQPSAPVSASTWKIDNPDRDLLGIIALREWVKADLESALLAAREGSLTEKRAVLETLMDSHPDRAFALAAIWGEAGRELQISKEGSNLCEFLEKWAAQDPAEALAYAMSTFPAGVSGSEADSLLAQIHHCVAGGWAAHDPGGCAAWISTLPAAQRSAALGGLRTSAFTIPEAVAGVLEILPRDPETDASSQVLAETWGSKAPQEAWNWLRGRFPEGPERLSAISWFALSVMDKEPRIAAAVLDEGGWKALPSVAVPPSYLTQGKDGEIRKPMLSSACGFGVTHPIADVLSRLAEVDPSAALTFYEKFDPEQKQEALPDMMEAWFHSDSQAALRWLAGRPDSEQEESTVSDVIHKLEGMTPAAMREFALRLPPGPVQKALAARSVSADVLVPDPADAIADLPFSDDAARSAATQEILKQWGETDPHAALDHLSSLPDADPDLYTSLTSGWTDRDPAAASAWVAALPPGENRDAAIAGLARSLNDARNESDPAAALLWSLEIGDPGERESKARGVVEAWSGNQAQTAEAIRTLNTNNALAEKDRQALLELLQR